MPKVKDISLTRHWMRQISCLMQFGLGFRAQVGFKYLEESIMFDKPNAMQTLGVELEGSTLKGVQLSLHKGQPALEQIFEIDINLEQTQTSADHVNPLYMSDDGQLLRNKIQQSLLATVLKSDEVLIRQLDLKLKKERDIDAVLSFQAEPLLPYPVENAVLDKITLLRTQEGTQLTPLGRTQRPCAAAYRLVGIPWNSNRKSFGWRTCCTSFF